MQLRPSPFIVLAGLALALVLGCEVPNTGTGGASGATSATPTVSPPTGDELFAELSKVASSAGVLPSGWKLGHPTASGGYAYAPVELKLSGSPAAMVSVIRFVESRGPTHRVARCNLEAGAKPPKMSCQLRLYGAAPTSRGTRMGDRLQEVMQLMPREGSLTRYQDDGRTLRLQGVAVAADVLQDYMARLDDAKTIRDARLAKAETHPDTRTAVPGVRFFIEAHPAD